MSLTLLQSPLKTWETEEPVLAPLEELCYLKVLKLALRSVRSWGGYNRPTLLRCSPIWFGL